MTAHGQITAAASDVNARLADLLSERVVEIHERSDLPEETRHITTTGQTPKVLSATMKS